MKRYIALLLAVLMTVFAFASCGADVGPKESAEEKKTEKSEKKDPIIGTWKTTDKDGTEWTLTLENDENDEGKGKFNIGNSSCEAEWKTEKDKIYVTAVYGDEKETVLEGEYKLENDKLTVLTKDGEKVFERAKDKAQNNK